MEKVILILYAVPLAFVFSYSIVQLSLVVHYLRRKKRANLSLHVVDNEEYPFVTIQLPVYNELYVVERLIDAVASIDYPKEQFEIQVLDDSTDESIALIQIKVSEWQAKGIQIQHICRSNRQGFKAGALANGLTNAKGEFLAIFDADFVPKSDFLTRTLPHFANKNVGVVQTRWSHLNEDYSLLTRLQAFGLDAHFSIEQSGRNAGEYFINFNGTAGIWRKTCIEDAEGWQSDTLTEDLDLSYRAQLKGWQFVYLEDVTSPSELPVEINAIKSQQFRWMKGAAECTRKHVWAVLKAPQLSLSTKIHALFHLLNSTTFIWTIWLSLLSVPMLWIQNYFQHYPNLSLLSGLFQLSLLNLALFYATSFLKHHSWQNFIWQFPIFLAFMMGLSLHNALAVIEGYIGKKTPFIRTPKFNIRKHQDQWTKNKYLKRKLSVVTFFEGFLTLYFLFAVFMAFQLQDYKVLPLHIILSIGFGSVFWYTLVHNRLQNTEQ